MCVHGDESVELSVNEIVCKISSFYLFDIFYLLQKKLFGVVFFMGFYGYFVWPITNYNKAKWAIFKFVFFFKRSFYS